MEIHQPLIHAEHPGTIDESTDTYDAVDWLVKTYLTTQVKGQVFGFLSGMVGISRCSRSSGAQSLPQNRACEGDCF